MYIDEGTDVLVVDENTPWPFQTNESLVILPFYGEFGHFVNSFLRQVHYLVAPSKVVCCRNGEEVYFPSATGFFYDWTDQFQPNQKVGFRDCWPPAAVFSPTHEELGLLARLRHLFPDYRLTFVAQPLRNQQVKTMPVPITYTSAAFPEVDVAVCCRHREWDAHRNFDRWQFVLEPLAIQGFRIGVVGEAETSVDFDFVTFRSWAHDCPAHGVVHALSIPRLYIGTDTGPSHLAALISRALLLFRNEACSYLNYLTETVTVIASGRGVPVRYLQEGWTQPERVRAAALQFLRHGTFL